MSTPRKQIPWLPKRGQWFRAFQYNNPPDHAHQCNPMRCVKIGMYSNDWFVYADRRSTRIMASRADFCLPASVWRFEPSEPYVEKVEE